MSNKGYIILSNNELINLYVNKLEITDKLI